MVCELPGMCEVLWGPGKGHPRTTDPLNAKCTLGEVKSVLPLECGHGVAPGRRKAVLRSARSVLRLQPATRPSGQPSGCAVPLGLLVLLQACTVSIWNPGAHYPAACVTDTLAAGLSFEHLFHLTPVLSTRSATLLTGDWGACRQRNVCAQAVYVDCCISWKRFSVSLSSLEVFVSFLSMVVSPVSQLCPVLQWDRLFTLYGLVIILSCDCVKLYCALLHVFQSRIKFLFYLTVS